MKSLIPFTGNALIKYDNTSMCRTYSENHKSNYKRDGNFHVHVAIISILAAHLFGIVTLTVEFSAIFQFFFFLSAIVTCCKYKTSHPSPPGIHLL